MQGQVFAFLQGWCTNVYGPTAFFVAYGKGLLRSVIADEKIVADLIPVDLAVNGLISAAMKTACDHSAQSVAPSPAPMRSCATRHRNFDTEQLFRKSKIMTVAIHSANVSSGLLDVKFVIAFC